MFKNALLSSLALLASSSIALAQESVPYIGGGIGFGSLSGLNAFAGYGAKSLQNPNFYLGGELLLNSLSYNVVNHFNYEVSASIIPGVLLSNNTMAYTRLGVAAFDHGSSGVGAQLGLGLQTSLATHWDVRGEYIYTSNLDNKQFNLGLLYKFN